MEYHLNLPVNKNEIKKLRVGDILYLSGTIFTSRDAGHKKMLDVSKLPFKPDDMALFHCGPLVKKDNGIWKVISAGPTTSIRMEIFEDSFIERFDISIIIGKGGMGKRTKKALQKDICVYTSFTGGAGVFAADKIEEVLDVFWIDELGMPEAIWIFNVKDFGPLIVSMDSNGNSIYEDIKNKVII